MKLFPNVGTPFAKFWSGIYSNISSALINSITMYLLCFIGEKWQEKYLAEIYLAFYLLIWEWLLVFPCFIKSSNQLKLSFVFQYFWSSYHTNRVPFSNGYSCASNHIFVYTCQSCCFSQSTMLVFNEFDGFFKRGKVTVLGREQIMMSRVYWHAVVVSRVSVCPGFWCAALNNNLYGFAPVRHVTTKLNTNQHLQPKWKSKRKNEKEK